MPSGSSIHISTSPPNSVTGSRMTGTPAAASRACSWWTFRIHRAAAVVGPGRRRPAGRETLHSTLACSSVAALGTLCCPSVCLDWPGAHGDTLMQKRLPVRRGGLLDVRGSACPPVRGQLRRIGLRGRPGHTSGKRVPGDDCGAGDQPGAGTAGRALGEPVPFAGSRGRVGCRVWGSGRLRRRDALSRFQARRLQRGEHAERGRSRGVVRARRAALRRAAVGAGPDRNRARASGHCRDIGESWGG